MRFSFFGHTQASVSCSHTRSIKLFRLYAVKPSRGVYSSPVFVKLQGGKKHDVMFFSCEQPLLNPGVIPTGEVYLEPFVIDTTTILRVWVSDDNETDAPDDAQIYTYLFPDVQSNQVRFSRSSFSLTDTCN